jgi:hypothetical protein
LTFKTNTAEDRSTETKELSTTVSKKETSNVSILTYLLKPLIYNIKIYYWLKVSLWIKLWRQLFIQPAYYQLLFKVCRVLISLFWFALLFYNKSAWFAQPLKKCIMRTTSIRADYFTSAFTYLRCTLST